ncbi:PDZ domain-containing protein 9 [Tiliqua scincoides]|uniref:PDZ domain-containing protein 9 n=1 Tax=Tiliqua scincoides TaxID=71010 RepID=UPI0034626E13
MHACTYEHPEQVHLLLPDTPAHPEAAQRQPGEEAEALRWRVTSWRRRRTCGRQESRSPAASRFFNPPRDLRSPARHAWEDEGTPSTNSEDYSGDSWDEDSSEESNHTLSATVKTYIQVEENGIGIILIQNGPYIQISGLVDNSAAAKDGKLQPGDILRKIGHANVLGCTLRELRQLLHTTCIGTVLQIQVYREFVTLPSRWENILEKIPEKKGPEIGTSSDDSEDWTSNEDSDEVTGGGVHAEDGGDGRIISGNKGGGDSNHVFGAEKEQRGGGSGDNSGWVGFVDKEDGSNDNYIFFSKKDGGSHVFGAERDRYDGGGGDGGGSSHVVSGVVEDDAINAKTIITGASHRPTHHNAVLCEKVVRSSIFGPSKQPRWISKDWHIFERKTHTFTVGSDIGCDIMIHNGCDSESDSDISNPHLRSSSPYWTLLKYNIESSVSSSSSAVSDVFWLEGFSHELD